MSAPCRFVGRCSDRIRLSLDLSIHFGRWHWYSPPSLRCNLLLPLFPDSLLFFFFFGFFFFSIPPPPTHSHSQAVSTRCLRQCPAKRRRPCTRAAQTWGGCFRCRAWALLWRRSSCGCCSSRCRPVSASAFFCFFCFLFYSFFFSLSLFLFFFFSSLFSIFFFFCSDSLCAFTLQISWIMCGASVWGWVQCRVCSFSTFATKCTKHRHLPNTAKSRALPLPLPLQRTAQAGMAPPQQRRVTARQIWRMRRPTHLPPSASAL